MTTPIRTSIVIPAYNETARIAPRLERIANYLRDHADTECIFVDDGSVDGTAQFILSFFENRHLPIRVQEHLVNKGKGGAIQTGVFLAAGEYVAFLDADLATDISCVAQCVELLSQRQADVACTSRYLPSSTVEIAQPLSRRLLGRAFRVVTHALFPALPVHDTQNGCKVFTASAARAVFTDLKTSRWAFDLEILLRATDRQLIIIEVPVTWHHREGGHLGGFQMVKMGCELLALWFDRQTKYWFVWPGVLSAILHAVFINWPQQAVFDEVYFSTFASSYFTGSYYFDIHPPLGKMLLAGTAWLFGYRGGGHFTAIGADPGIPWIQLFAFRLLPMLAGMALPVVVSLCVAQYTKSRRWALTAGLLVALETGFLVQTRYAFLDGLLVLFGFSALLMYGRYRRTERPLPFIGAMVLAALAVDIKWTALTFLGLIALCECVHLFEKPFVLLRRAFLGLALCSVVYLAPFVVHLSLLREPGPGDAFMPPHFQEHNIAQNILDLNREMYASNQRIIEKHPYGSAWFTWPFMVRPVFYWSNNNATQIERIYYFGNPAIYLLAFLSVGLLILALLLRRIAPHHRSAALLVVAGYLANLLPFIAIHRVMFLYHYLTALMFGIIATALVGEALVPARRQKTAMIAVLTSAAVCFLFFSPLVYGLSEPEWLLRIHQWLPTWD